MARIPPYIWDVGLALGLFLLYLELKNINLVSNEEKQLWQDYYNRQQQQQQSQRQGQHGGGLDLGGIFDWIGKIANPLAGTQGVMG